MEKLSDRFLQNTILSEEKMYANDSFFEGNFIEKYSINPIVRVDSLSRIMWKRITSYHPNSNNIKLINCHFEWGKSSHLPSQSFSASKFHINSATLLTQFNKYRLIFLCSQSRKILQWDSIKLIQSTLITCIQLGTEVVQKAFLYGS